MDLVEYSINLLKDFFHQSPALLLVLGVLYFVFIRLETAALKIFQSWEENSLKPQRKFVEHMTSLLPKMEQNQIKSNEVSVQTLDLISTLKNEDVVTFHNDHVWKKENIARIAYELQDVKKKLDTILEFQSQHFTILQERTSHCIQNFQTLEERTRKL